MSTFGDTLQGCEDIYARKVKHATWGHLAPKRGSRYKLRIVFAVGCLGSDDLNPTPICFESRKLSSSPWFYDFLRSWLSNRDDENRKSGCIYEFKGWFRDYRMTGIVSKLLDANMGGERAALSLPTPEAEC